MMSTFARRGNPGLVDDNYLGLSHPAWSLGTFGRTIVTTGMPNFENSDSEKRIPVIARNVVREFSGRARRRS
jgi:hypothetical protein